MTVNELKKHVDQLVAEGYGDSVVVLSNSVSEDPEDFCFLEAGFSSPAYNSSGLQEFLENNDTDDENIVVLN